MMTGLLQAQSIMPYVREENQIEEVDNLEAERAAVAEKEVSLAHAKMRMRVSYRLLGATASLTSAG